MRLVTRPSLRLTLIEDILGARCGRTWKEVLVLKRKSDDNENTEITFSRNTTCTNINVRNKTCRCLYVCKSQAIAWTQIQCRFFFFIFLCRPLKSTCGCRTLSRWFQSSYFYIHCIWLDTRGILRWVPGVSLMDLYREHRISLVSVL